MEQLLIPSPLLNLLRRKFFSRISVMLLVSNTIRWILSIFILSGLNEKVQTVILENT